MYTREQFENMRLNSAAEMSKDNELQKSAIELLIRADQYNWIHQTNWFGEPILNLPQDMFAIQEIIFKTRPKYIIEIGVAWGGSLLFYSTIMQVLGGEKIIGIDIYIPDDLKQRIGAFGAISDRIAWINGSSIDTSTVDQVKSLLNGHKEVLVLLDSNHTHEHVLEELKLYSPLVGKGNYIVVGDTVIEDIPYQTHGSEILEIDNSFFQLTDDEKSNALNGIDALITQLTNVCIGVFTADCVPLIFYDPSKQVIAVAHAGWRGTCARIAEKTVRTMIDKYDCQPSTIRTAIGPSISPKVYEIGQEVADHFESAGFDISAIITTHNRSLYLDLWKANQLSLEKAGVLSEHIEVSGICTFTEHERFFSARRLGIKSGRMQSGIMLKGG